MMPRAMKLRMGAFRMVIGAVCIVALFGFAPSIIPVLITHVTTPPLYDHNLLRIDEIITGGRPSFAIGSWVAQNPARWHALWIVYQNIGLALAVLFILAVNHPDRIKPWTVLALIFGIGIAGGLLYVICPGAGPRYVFHFPADPGYVPLGAIPCPAGAPSNATPSLHCAWAILVFMVMRRFGAVLTWLSGIFAILTMVATMGIGEHYIADIVVAFPLCLAIYDTARRRYGTAAFGAVVTVAWQVCARFLPSCSSAFAALAPAAALCAVILIAGRFPAIRTTARAARQKMPAQMTPRTVSG